MPFKSQAQRRKFYAMARRGEISEGTVKRWEDETPKGKKLPEKVMKKESSAAKAIAIPAAVFGTGAAAGYGGRKESQKWKLWRQGGNVILVRRGKEKQAFETKMAMALLATGRDTEKVAEAYHAELEKIAFIGMAAKGIGGLIRGGRTAAKAVQSGGSRAMSAVGEYGGKLRRMGEDLADVAQRKTVEVGQQFRAGLGGRNLAAQQQLEATQNAAAVRAKHRASLAAPKGAPKSPTTSTAQQQAAATTGAPAVQPPPAAAAGGGPPVTSASGVPAAGAEAGAAPGIMDQISQGMQTHLGVNPQGGMAQFGDKGMGQWFQGLSPEQRRNLAGLGIGGVGAAGLAAGYGMAGGGGNTVVYT